MKIQSVWHLRGGYRTGVNNCWLPRTSSLIWPILHGCVFCEKTKNRQSLKSLTPWQPHLLSLSCSPSSLALHRHPLGRRCRRMCLSPGDAISQAVTSPIVLMSAPKLARLCCLPSGIGATADPLPDLQGQGSHVRNQNNFIFQFKLWALAPLQISVFPLRRVYLFTFMHFLLLLCLYLLLWSTNYGTLLSYLSTGCS